MENELVTAPEQATKFTPKEESIKVGSGTVVSRTKKDGSKSYQAKVRKNGVNLSQTFSSLKEAKEWITKTEAKLLNGESISPNKIKKTTLAEVFQEFLKDNPKISENKKGRIERLILEIGKVSLEEFKTRFLFKWMDFKLNQEIPDQAKKKKSHKLFNGNRTIDENGNEVKRVYKPGTIRKYYYDIKMSLEHHAKMHDYQFNSKPFDEVAPPPAWGDPRDRRLEEGELEKLLEACNKLYVNVEQSKILIRFLAFSAFRVGETMMIKWKDIKLNKDRPEESYIFIPKENQKIAHKKGAEDRYASLRPELYNLIVDELLPYKEGKKDDDYVFSFWSSPGYFYTRFKNICFNAGSKDLTIHDLRHEGVSWFFENTTLSDIEIAKITGHIELSTLQKYAKLRPHKTGAKLWNSIVQQ
ncbi:MULTISPECIES: tyrosine-type recombinase/integrase [Burkholderiaceae]|uniref:Phage integrase n=2 Tax=Burkholderiaceae TaxID=119060 RepID=A0A6J5JHQ4_9BURK|nr:MULTISPECIES: tyrosine-type recombinase/integrase [Burkholderiaceae]ANJ73145.1 hypothetical protein A9Y76_11955 [Ralstonia insidiosa]KAB0601782.1 tyrosine-type recombinase/integrase [Cupriavidus pauculus]MBH9720454.1 tyrosine-type recombinase/integrase [Burkholderia contaminans]MBR8495153.1 tyrosine-type recombinase/integrase [Burkholderia cenocepacia]MCO8393846.1 tyrosine-type recombinase/integrase [Burkholderia cenocepacia]